MDYNNEKFDRNHYYKFSNSKTDFNSSTSDTHLISVDVEFSV